MKKTRLSSALLLLAALLLLSACSLGGKLFPKPKALMEEIKKMVLLPELSEMPESYLEQNTGISAADCEEFVFAVPKSDTSATTIVIIAAKSAEAADQMETKLKSYRSLMEQSAQLYLTGNLSAIQNGVVRRDGQTVSLLVSENLPDILAVYDAYK